MGKYKYLNQKQAAVLEDLFNSELDEQGVLEKHRVRRSTFERWLDDDLFAERFDLYIQRIRRRSELLLAKYRGLAAAKLIELTTSKKPETARKACLDIISQPKIKTEAETAEKESSRQAEAISDAQASRILAAIAEEKEIPSTKS
jgi:hypothetical protein